MDPAALQAKLQEQIGENANLKDKVASLQEQVAELTEKLKTALAGVGGAKGLMDKVTGGDGGEAGEEDDKKDESPAEKLAEAAAEAPVEDVANKAKNMLGGFGF